MEEAHSSSTGTPTKPLDEYFHFYRDEPNGTVLGAQCQIRGEKAWMAAAPFRKADQKEGGNGKEEGDEGEDTTDLSGTVLARYSILMPDDPDFQKVKDIQGQGTQMPASTSERSCENDERNGAFSSNPALDRALGSFVSMAVGDALGASLEFKPVRYDDGHPMITGMDQYTKHFGLGPGQWTDDASMGLCVADSLLMRQGFDPYDLKNRFVSWWQFGYNNSTRLAPEVEHSVGLGGNIGESLQEFQETGEVNTKAGTKRTCGNGSLMRNGAVPCYYHNDLEGGLKAARAQSYLTHQGIEAAELCAALTFLVWFAVNNPTCGKTEILESIGAKFETDCASVQHLVKAQAESKTTPTQEAAEEGADPDRDWRWKGETYHYAPTRAKSQPGYVGSYAMDALAMALHCVHKTDNFADALLMAANRCGDADTVCAITGQVAGAVYGYSAIPKSWLHALNQWDGNEFTVKGFKMFYKHPARYPTTSGGVIGGVGTGGGATSVPEVQPCPSKI